VREKRAQGVKLIGLAGDQKNPRIGGVHIDRKKRLVGPRVKQQRGNFATLGKKCFDVVSSRVVLQGGGSRGLGGSQTRHSKPVT